MAAHENSPSDRRRASRRERVAGRGARLRQRDLDILLAIAKMRLLSTADISRLFFSAKGTCQKRMRKLFDAKLVQAVVSDLAAENRYALTPLGHALLVEALGEESVPPWRRCPRADGRKLAHLSLLNRYRIALACGAAAAGVSLDRFVPEWELRAAAARAPIIPDAIAILSSDEAGIALAVEVDTGSEPPRTVAKKVEAYVTAAVRREAVFGSIAPTVLIVAATVRRARSVARAIVKGSSSSIWIGAPPYVLVDGGLESGLVGSVKLARCEGDLDGRVFGRGLLRVEVPSGARRAMSAAAHDPQPREARRVSAESPRAAAGAVRSARA